MRKSRSTTSLLTLWPEHFSRTSHTRTYAVTLTVHYYCADPWRIWAAFTPSDGRYCAFAQSLRLQMQMTAITRRSGQEQHASWGGGVLVV